MTVTYRIDKPSGLIHTRCAGGTTLSDVLDHFRVLSEDPDCPERLDVLLDLSDLETIPESHQLREVTREIARVRERVRFDAIAIVATRDVIYGMARVFEVFAQSQFRATQVFRALPEAEAWLTAQRQQGA
jgi:hypothetical protein